MAVGFAERTKTSNDYVKNFFKNSRNYKRDFPTICDRVIAVRQEWEDDYFNRKHTYTKEELLGKDYRGLEEPYCQPADTPVWSRASHKDMELLHMGNAGAWGITTSFDHQVNVFDFTITVDAGDCQRMHPDAIEKDIVSKFGRSTYNEWRSLVMSQFDLLQHLVDLFRETINYPCPSITCCERSERLCKSLGLPVRNGIAFLLPSSYK